MYSKSNSFFFSKLLNQKIYDRQDSLLGKVSDVILDFSEKNPFIITIEIKMGNRKVYVSSGKMQILKDEKENYFLKLDTDHPVMTPIPNNGVFLARNFLDKQIVDVDGHKVERINDIRIGKIGEKWTVIAVDIGLRGLLRRIGIEYQAICVCAFLNRQFRNKLLLWDNVQPLSGGLADIQLQTSMNKLKTLHSADIADIIEDLDRESQMILMHNLGDEKAAEVLEEMEQDDQVSLLKTLPDERASDLLEMMPSDEAADILENIEDKRAEILLGQMENENSSEIRELMEYEDKTVGSVMKKEFLAFKPENSTADVISFFQGNEMEEELSHYIYLTDEKDHLQGIISLLSVIAVPEAMVLEKLKLEYVYSVRDEERIDHVLDIMQKYNLEVLPVTDDKNVLIGTIFLNDLIHEFIKLRRLSA